MTGRERGPRPKCGHTWTTPLSMPTMRPVDADGHPRDPSDRDLLLHSCYRMPWHAERRRRHSHECEWCGVKTVSHRAPEPAGEAAELPPVPVGGVAVSGEPTRVIG